jgi:hypothetical protein
MRTFDSKDQLFGIIDSLNSRIEKKGKRFSMCIIIHRGYSLGGNPVLGGRLEHNSVFGRDWHGCCFLFFRKSTFFNRPDKESSGSRTFPLLHHWPKWKQSAHSSRTLWFPLPIPRGCQVWGPTVHTLFTLGFVLVATGHKTTAAAGIVKADNRAGQLVDVCVMAAFLPCF